jgi:hypothetical protein
MPTASSDEQLARPGADPNLNSMSTLISPRETTTNPDGIIEAMERAPRIVVPLVREVPRDVLKRRPAPRRWSAHEHACHLAHVHGLFSHRLDLMLREPAPVITPYQPGEQDDDEMLLRMDLDESLERFVADRAKLVARVRELSPAEWTRTASHPEYRAYSVLIMFRHLVLHDFLHAYRIEELLLKPDWHDA